MRHPARPQRLRFDADALAAFELLVATPDATLGRRDLPRVLWELDQPARVAPGALAEYGGGEARLKRGKIRAPAEGFFVGGSSIGEMNGVYARVYRWQVAHEFVYCYRKWPADEPDRMEVGSTYPHAAPAPRLP